MRYTSNNFEVNLKNILAKSSKDIKTKDSGILDVPEKFMVNSNIGTIGSKMIDQAKIIGKGPVMGALNSLARWNEKRNPAFSRKMISVVEKLKGNKYWDDIPARAE